MNLEKPSCPTCGERAIGSCETLPAIALFVWIDDDTTDYLGETKPCWANQESELDENGQILITCGTHKWYSAF